MHVTRTIPYLSIHSFTCIYNNNNKNRHWWHNIVWSAHIATFFFRYITISIEFRWWDRFFCSCFNLWLCRGRGRCRWHHHAHHTSYRIRLYHLISHHIGKSIYNGFSSSIFGWLFFVYFQARLCHDFFLVSCCCYLFKIQACSMVARLKCGKALMLSLVFFSSLPIKRHRMVYSRAIRFTRWLFVHGIMSASGCV